MYETAMTEMMLFVVSHWLASALCIPFAVAAAAALSALLLRVHTAAQIVLHLVLIR